MSKEQEEVNEAQQLSSQILLMVLTARKNPVISMSALSIAMGVVLASQTQEKNALEVALSPNGPLIRSCRIAALDAIEKVEAIKKLGGMR